MSSTDSILVGTSWTRSKGQHHPIVGIIDSVGSRGPRLKTSHRFYRLIWAEIGNSWQPADAASKETYEKWVIGAALEEAMKVTVDKNLTIVTAERDEEVMPEIKECHGAWHRYPGKKGEPVTYKSLPVSQFSIATRGPNRGQLGSTCNSCTEKSRRSYRKANPVLVAAPIQIAPVVETSDGLVYRWKVVVIQTVEHFVQAKDFLDAAAQVSGFGEITRVEKL